MNNKDLKLFENLLEDFCTQSDFCKNCPYKHFDENKNKNYCFFGVECIFKNILTNDK